MIKILDSISPLLCVFLRNLLSLKRIYIVYILNVYKSDICAVCCIRNLYFGKIVKLYEERLYSRKISFMISRRETFGFSSKESVYRI